jgi:hypothetical protein
MLRLRCFHRLRPSLWNGESQLAWAGRVRRLTFLIILSLSFRKSYFQTASGFSFATGFPPLMCSSMMVATSASVTLEYQVASG